MVDMIYGVSAHSNTICAMRSPVAITNGLVVELCSITIISPIVIIYDAALDCYALKCKATPRVEFCIYTFGYCTG